MATAAEVRSACINCGSDNHLVALYDSLNGLPLCDECISKVVRLYHFLNDDDRPEPPYSKTPIPEELRWRVFERDAFKCKHCGSQRFLRADHIAAESKGGPTTLENLQTLCRSCNSKKGAS